MDDLTRSLIREMVREEVARQLPSAPPPPAAAPSPDLSALTSRLTALEQGQQAAAEERGRMLRAVAALERPPTPDLTALEERLGGALERLDALPPPPDLTPLGERLAALEERTAAQADTLARLGADLDAERTEARTRHERVVRAVSRAVLTPAQALEVRGLEERVEALETRVMGDTDG